MARTSLTLRERLELLELFRAHYAHVSRETFERDLDAKHHVLLLRDPEGGIRGFTSMRLGELVHQGRAIRTVFSGNTIIDPAHWGDMALVTTWCEFMAELKRERPHVALYWYLIASGFRTYLFLPLFFRRFTPKVGASADPFATSLLERLGNRDFPAEYADGIVRPATPRECLDSDLAIPTTRRLANPHVRFFLEANPGYLRGDELVCLAEYSFANTRRAARAALERAREIAG